MVQLSAEEAERRRLFYNQRKREKRVEAKQKKQEEEAKKMQDEAKLAHKRALGRERSRRCYARKRAEKQAAMALLNNTQGASTQTLGPHLPSTTNNGVPPEVMAIESLFARASGRKEQTEAYRQALANFVTFLEGED